MIYVDVYPINIGHTYYRHLKPLIVRSWIFSPLPANYRA